MNDVERNDAVLLDTIDAFVNLGQVELANVEANLTDAMNWCEIIVPHVVDHRRDVAVALSACAFFATLCRLRMRGYSFALIESKEKP